MLGRSIFLLEIGSGNDRIAGAFDSGGTQLSRGDVHHYVRSAIDLYVQLSRAGGRRYVSQVATGAMLDWLG